MLAARVRTRRPASPARARDIELAAIAATSGLPLATEDQRDFTAIAELIGEVAPRLTLELRASVFA